MDWILQNTFSQMYCVDGENDEVMNRRFRRDKLILRLAQRPLARIALEAGIGGHAGSHHSDTRWCCCARNLLGRSFRPTRRMRRTLERSGRQPTNLACARWRQDRKTSRRCAASTGCVRSWPSAPYHVGDSVAWTAVRIRSGIPGRAESGRQRGRNAHERVEERATGLALD